MQNHILKEFRRARGFIQFSSFRAAGQIISMIIPLVLAKVFAPDKFGSYSLAKMIVFLFTMLLVSSPQIPFIVEANEERKKSGRINESFSSYTVIMLLSLIIFAISSFAMRRQFAAFASITQTELIASTAAFIGIASKSFVSNIFMALGNMRLNAAAEFAYGVLVLAGTIILLSLERLTISTIFLTYFFSGIVLLALAVRFIHSADIFPIKVRLERTGRILRFTAFQLTGITAVYFINWADNLVLRYYADLGQIGEYNLAYQFFKGLVSLLTVMGFYFLPSVTGVINNPGALRTYLYEKRPRVLIVATVGMAAAFFLAPAFLHWAYGEKYHDAGIVLRILLLASIPALHNTMYNVIYTARKLFSVLQLGDVGQLIINVALNLVLVPRMGIRGAALATVIAYIAKTVALQMHFSLVLKKRLGIDASGTLRSRKTPVGVVKNP